LTEENGKREASGVKRSRPHRLSGHKEKNCHVHFVSLLFAGGLPLKLAALGAGHFSGGGFRARGFVRPAQGH